MEGQDYIYETTQNEIICRSCSSKLIFTPGTNKLICGHCGAENEIAGSADIIEELNFGEYIAKLDEKAQKQDVVTVKCNACSAQTSFEENVVSGSCPFCGNPLVISSGTLHRNIQPKSLLPFLIDKKKAMDMYTKWLKKLWWAPNDLLKNAIGDGKLIGMYIPYWTYDAETSSSYRGERGIDHTETQHYQTTENGKTVTRTRNVTRTDWSPVSGQVNNDFDDVLVVASCSLPKSNTEKLEPWDLQNLVPFHPDYLSGFKTECYQVDLKEGFEEAKFKMENPIRNSILQDIGGDHQRIDLVNTSYRNVTFKHTLLPIWLSSYKHNKKVYRFLINGRSGEVQGQRPYSWIKITLAILAVVGIIALIFLLVQK